MEVWRSRDLSLVTTRSGGLGGLAKLLDDPLRRWVVGDVEEQDVPAPMDDDEEHIQPAGPDRRDRASPARPSPAQGKPEDAIGGVHVGSRALMLKRTWVALTST